MRTKNKFFYYLLFSSFLLFDTCASLKSTPLAPIIKVKPNREVITEYVRRNQNAEEVLSFYDSITQKREITKVIISNALRWDVPINLAFALAKVESHFNKNGKNYNLWNDSWDRGLFQLNNKSFPNLQEEQFFNPDISSYYGLQYLHDQIIYFNNIPTAIIAYNWGPGRAVTGKEPPNSVLSYLNKIKSYEKEYNDLFADRFSRV